MEYSKKIKKLTFKKRKCQIYGVYIRMKGGFVMKVLTNAEMCQINGGCYIMIKGIYTFIKTFMRTLKYHY